MLKSFLSSIPFLLIRIVIIILEGITLLACGFYGSSFVIDFASQYASGLFLTMLTPMAWIIGLGVGALLVKYLFGFFQYYIKLAHIIFLTSIILEYKPVRGSRFTYALNEAIDNFGYLAINDFTTRTIIKALEALKDAIMDNDIASKFTDIGGKFAKTDSTSYKLAKAMALTSLRNVINMTDEIIVSYTWFTHTLYKADRKRLKKKMPGRMVRTKNQAKFMLEGLTFLVRVFPKLLLNSVLFEILIFMLANVAIITIVFVAIGISQFSFPMIFFMIVFYRTLLHIFYYCLVHSFRLFFYIYTFYYEVGKIEPFNIEEGLGKLLGKIPLLGPLIKRSGQDITPTGSEGEPILEGDITQVLKESVTEVAQAFNLNADDLVQDNPEEVNDLTSIEEAERLLKEKEKAEAKEKENQSEKKTEEKQETPEPVVEVTEPVEPEIDLEVEIELTEEVEIEVEESENKPTPTVNPFVGRSRSVR